MLKVDKNGKRFYQINKNIKQYSDCVVCIGKSSVLEYLKNFASEKWLVYYDNGFCYYHNLQNALNTMIEDTLNYSKIYYDTITIQKINKKTYHIYGY